MYELFNENKTYILPSGKQETGKSLKSSGNYPMLSLTDCAVNLNGGILGSFSTVDALAEMYGIDSSLDNENIIVLVNNLILSSRRTKIQTETTASSVQTVAKIVASSFTDEQALQVPDLYDEYQVDHAYKKDERFTYNGVLFKVNQDHTSASQWVPGETGTESLYTKIVLNEDGYDVWKQPTGAHDAYNTGDIVEYKGQLYKSLIDGNAYAPDVYPAGWELYTEE